MLYLTAVAASAHVPLQWVDLGLTRGIDLGFFMLRWYSLAYLVGIIFGYWHLSKMIRQSGAPLAQRHVDDLFFYCTMGIILGGRLGYALFYGPQLLSQPLELLKLWEGGMSFHGGLIGVTAAIAYVCWRDKLSFLGVCDYIAPCAPVGLMLGRMANFVNGELWGRVATGDVPWAMVFPDQTAGPLPRHPSQLYEAGLEGLLLALILIPLFWKTGARWRRGLMTGIFALGYGLARFVVEFFREPDAQLSEFARSTHMSMGQWLTVPMIVLGLIFIINAWRKPPLGSGSPAAA